MEELTYNVNWLRYPDAAKPPLLVHFRDGRPPEAHDLAELTKFTARRVEHQQLLASIDYIEVFYDNQWLKILDLIDTPGLDSYFGTDSENTLRFLGRTPDEVRTSTIEHAHGADALLHVFSRNIGGTDEETLAEFRGPGLGSATPINAIGVLTKVEHYWPSCPDPMKAGRAVTGRLMDEPLVRRLLFSIQPVCSLVGLAAETFTDDDFQTLVELARTPPDVLERRAGRAPFFCTRVYDDLPVTPERRKLLHDRFGGWGVVLACRLLRDGIATPEDLRRALLDRSGMAELRRMVVSHFGNRAYLIKLRPVIEQVLQLRHEVRLPLPGDRAALNEAIAQFERLAVNEHAFKELTVLQHYYEDRLTLSEPELHEALRVTGEHGVWITDRLGLDRGATLDEMYERADQRRAFWSSLSTDPEIRGETASATRVLRRSYEILVHHIGEARRHLELVQ